MTLPPRVRRALLFVWLALALAMTTLLAFQAIYADRSHRATTEGVLRNYAHLAASEMVDRLQFRFAYYSCAPLVQWAPQLATFPRGGALPSPSELGASADVRAKAALANVRSIHRYRLASDGDPTPDPTLPGWIPALVDRHAREEFAAAWEWAAVFSDSGGFVYGPARDENGLLPETFVFVLDPDSVTTALATLAGASPLLPQFLLGADQQGEWLHVAVRVPGSAPWWESGSLPATSAGAATVPVGGTLGSWEVTASLAEDAVAEVAPGGEPSSNQRVVLGLLILSAGLLVGAFLQVRREAELARLREDFLAGISHELRTPLAQIRMFADTLLLGRVRTEEERVRSLEIIGRESRRLSHLVENVLLDSRASRGVLRANVDRIHLSALLDDVSRGFEPLARSKGVRLHHTVEPNLQVDADADLLRQAVLNLLDNAVKYGPKGQTVTLGAARSADGLKLWVDDEGPGIPSGQRGRVWNRFARLDRDRASVTAGTGIGLAVVRDLVALQGGRVSVGEAPGGGARFTLSFPDRNGGAA
ncbi:MAG: hypothetical protein DHS20C21_08830 [Gemmatimonadota bacterium]|nr:MAG: hypothetical protein DHS20C21_08830 [Gemmatimonadota bacterium]